LKGKNSLNENNGLYQNAQQKQFKQKKWFKQKKRFKRKNGLKQNASAETVRTGKKRFELKKWFEPFFGSNWGNMGAHWEKMVRTKKRFEPERC
jgi:hypothetical protein